MNWLFKYIHELQQLPLEQKKSKAKIVAGVLTFIVFLFWVSGLVVSDSHKTAQQASIDIAPLQGIKEAVFDIGRSVSSMKKGIDSLSGTTTEH